MYEEGRGVDKDEARAVEWLIKAGENGHQDAQILLGFYFEKGRGVKPDLAKALTWYRRANRQKNEFATKGIARIERDHPEIAQEIVEAEARQQARRDQALRLGLEALASGDHTAAFEHWKPLAEEGDARAQAQLGRLYAEGLGTAKDAGKALTWYRKAAERGEAVAEDGLGVLYMTGDGVAEDPEQAMQWFRRAAAQGLSRAELHIGAAFERGQGVARNPVEAAKWYRRAAEQGLKEAKDSLARVESAHPETRAAAPKPEAATAPASEAPPAAKKP